MSCSMIATRKRLVWTGSWLVALLLGPQVESFGRSLPFLSRRTSFINGSAGTRKEQVQQASVGHFEALLTNELENEPTADAAKSNEIVVSSEIDLPFPSDVAFDAFSDMSRQTSWSPWLQSVEYTDESRNTTLWKMKYLGVSSSWVSVCTYEARPHTICWKSIQGLPNRGRVDFVGYDESKSTRMKMTMSFQVPRLIAKMFASNGKISRTVEKRMLLPTLETFCQDVIQNDCLVDKAIADTILTELAIPLR